jgi:hypothetical protein
VSIGFISSPRTDDAALELTLGAMTVDNVTLPIRRKGELERLIAAAREADAKAMVQRLRTSLDPVTFARVMRALK